MLVTFLFWRAPVKYECVILFGNEVHQDGLSLKFVGSRLLVPRVEYLLVPEGSD